MYLHRIPQAPLARATALLDGIGMSRLSCAHRCFNAEVIYVAVVHASATLGRSVPSTLERPSYNCWPEWHDADDNPFDTFMSADPFGVLCGKVYRLYLSCSDYKALCHELPCGLSLVIWPDRTGTLAVYEGQEGALPRVGSILCRLREDGAVSRAIPGGLLLTDVGEATNLDVLKRFDTCAFEWEEEQPDGSCTFDHMHIALAPTEPGRKFRFTGCPDPQVTKDGDLLLCTPNCDWLGHYLLRPADDTPAAAVVETEATYWGPFLAQQEAVRREAKEARDRARRERLLRAAPAVSSNVTVLSAFVSICESEVQLQPGDVGVTQQIDDDGDAQINFHTHGELWVDSKDYPKLRSEP
mmetsp:Transcript_3379/g.7762  ORF Transcript_3379/g.7762 Transcript_3379/m.7762 type:complete len:355 (+) Transcript_3379:63-1127(+)|eukprot:CAMPEP_0197904928 /NCGR_PEP_ID=MMETSP1439-20131203/59132_1 /TAXON_ID=66791 /ORGANISM="Gonyaulax spinifera, Strain CCMP409" /LENGTH=354 /DNA_ID=CAMNT_0043526165 /DNA_START=62 /DNA_END=1126 /DNA_ORIENTATION=+